MKIITCGDIHGSTLWKNIVPEEWDRIVFVGDYVDHWTYTDAHILKNLKEIIILKEIYPSKVVLLVGNHDASYMFDGRMHSCSGKRYSMAIALQELFKEKMILFQAAHHEESEEGDKYLWTHAGVSEGWYINRMLPFLEKIDNPPDNIGDQLNFMFKIYRRELFDVGYERYGDRDFGGIVWADRSETQSNPLPNINQIVGHTKLDKITKFDFKDKNASITYVDVLEGNSPEFHEMEV